MFWRYRKVLRDRAAGMVFDWRRGHGSSYRVLIAFAECVVAVTRSAAHRIRPVGFVCIRYHCLWFRFLGLFDRYRR